ncbi:MAG: hypothetical protein Kow002_05110 [Anaerolineales bacterium]
MAQARANERERWKAEVYARFRAQEREGYNTTVGEKTKPTGLGESKPWWESILEYQYTPIIAGAVSVLATDAAFVLLATSASPTAPVTLVAAGVCWGIGRVASLVAVTSTGYQYKNQLHGITKFDLQITVATYGISFIPKPDMAAMNHIGFLYSCYTTFIR